MTNKKFDAEIRSKMADHKVRYDPLSWYSLENQLEQSFEQGQIDQNLQQKLKNHKADFKASHWGILKKRLDLQDELQRKIYITKFAEATILLLLIVSFLHLNPYPNSHPSISSPEVQSDLRAQNSQNSIQRPEFGENVANLAKETGDHLNNEVTSKSTGSSSQSEELSEREEKYIGGTPRASLHEPQPIGIKTGFPSSARSHNLLVDLAQGMVNSPSNEPLTRESESHAIDKSLFFESLESVNNRLAYTSLAPKYNAVYPAKSRRQRNIKRLGAFTSLDLNVVNRPLDLKIFQQPQQYGAFGSTFGVLYGSQKGHHEFETGLAFSKKTYDPNLKEQVNVSTSSYERDFNKMSFDMFQIPFNYKLHSTTKKGWNMYAFVGADIHIVAFTDYQFHNVLKSGQPRTKNAIENNSKLIKTRDFHDGLFQGGPVVKNIYLTGAFGFGLERYFGNQSVYIQPLYRQHLFTQQLGPNNEKLNSLSIQVGTKFNLN